MLDEARSPNHLFSRPRRNLPPPEESGTESVALKQIFLELVNEYNRNDTALRKTRFVCIFSSNNDA